MKDCIFCEKSKINQDIIYRDDNFFTKVGFGLVTAGHSMLISNMHLLGFAELPFELEKEYERAKQTLSNKIRKNFSTPFLVEYCVWGQSVPHAHTHFIPTETENYKIGSILEEMIIPSRVPFKEISNIRELNEIYKNQRSYVLVEQDGQKYACLTKGFPFDRKNPQVLSYRGLFKQKGLSMVLNWKEISEEDKRLDEEKRKLTMSLLG